MYSTNTSQGNRIIVLDTETTGMNFDGGAPHLGHRVIEIGAVEIINRKLTGKHFHVYINPSQAIDAQAIEVHGITDEFLADKPDYAKIHDDFFAFIQNAELVAHNASFDVGFLDQEFALFKQSHPKAQIGQISDYCQVTDTLQMAKKLFPGKRNNLDVLCERYGIDNSHRTLHGALLDAEILAEVYLLMTGGQTAITFGQKGDENREQSGIKRLAQERLPLKVLMATPDELSAHQDRLDTLQKVSPPLWRAKEMDSTNSDS